MWYRDKLIYQAERIGVLGVCLTNLRTWTWYQRARIGKRRIEVQIWKRLGNKQLKIRVLNCLACVRKESAIRRKTKSRAND